MGRTPLQMLVVGYGNDLRSDDGAGHYAVRAVESRGLPGVRMLTAHQLMPELAEDISRADAVVFADAYAASVGDVCRVSRIRPEMPSAARSHALDPQTLLWYALALYGSAPEAWIVAIPATTFELGEELSQTARDGVDEASRRIAQILTRFAQNPESASYA